MPNLTTPEWYDSTGTKRTAASLDDIPQVPASTYFHSCSWNYNFESSHTNGKITINFINNVNTPYTVVHSFLPLLPNTPHSMTYTWTNGGTNYTASLSLYLQTPLASSTSIYGYFTYIAGVSGGIKGNSSSISLYSQAVTDTVT